MIHMKMDGTNNEVFILLHGTGGDEQSLVPIARYLDRDATLIGVRGNVEEGEMFRFFARYPDMSFDLKSLAKETKLLYEGIEQTLREYGLEDHRVTLIGYSNGANVALNMFKEYETKFARALLFHPSNGRPEVDYKPQHALELFMTYGENDPFLDAADFAALEAKVKEAGIKYATFTHEMGHQLIEAELQAAMEMLHK